MLTKRTFPKRLRVMADHASSGIWVIEPIGPFRHGMIEHKRLGLPENLAERFAAWINCYSAQLTGEHFDVGAFNREGQRLAKDLKAFVGRESEVIFQPEADDGGLASPEVM